MEDPFATLGLEPRLDLDAAELEARYLELSRDCHPDRHPDVSDAERTEVLMRSAQVNDAYRAVREVWSRARVLLERLDRTALDRNKDLSPAFLAEAMELAEDVANTQSRSTTALAEKLEATIAADLSRIRAALDAGDADIAATVFHESTYHRKARDDLGAAKAHR